MKLRIGHGYDVHRFCQDRPLYLGCVQIPHNRGLLGHSDADVLCHAIMDALLGACGLRDIGYYFPDNDPSYKGASGESLLTKTKKLLDDNGFQVENVDATLIAQVPKLAPYIDTMRDNVARILQIPKEDVGIKATTEERLGFTGREEGIAAHAVCLVKK